MPDIRLLAIDVDGTLINGQHELTDATRAAVLRAKRSGIEIVLASGRRYSRVLPLVEPLELNVPLITASGALIKRAADHVTLYRAQFAPSALEQCLQIVDAAGFSPILYADTYDQGFDYYAIANSSTQTELNEFLEFNAGSERIHRSLAADPPSGIFAGFAMGTHEQMLGLQSQLEHRLGDSLYVHVLRSPRYRGFMCEIAPHGVSKWTGVMQVAKSLGIAPVEICAVGDDVNDIPMIVGAGLGVAMGNALDAVKQAADRVAPGNNEDGLVQVVEWLLARG